MGGKSLAAVPRGGMRQVGTVQTEQFSWSRIKTNQFNENTPRDFFKLYRQVEYIHTYFFKEKR
jgi:hypothetical protein